MRETEKMKEYDPTQQRHPAKQVDSKENIDMDYEIALPCTVKAAVV